VLSFFSVVLESYYSGLSNLGVYPVDLKLLKRRAEMLDAVSTGLHPVAVVGQLNPYEVAHGDVSRKIPSFLISCI